MLQAVVLGPRGSQADKGRLVAPVRFHPFHERFPGLGELCPSSRTNQAAASPEMSSFLPSAGLFGSVMGLGPCLGAASEALEQGGVPLRDWLIEQCLRTVARSLDELLLDCVF